MNKTLHCDIVRDLYPLYAEKLASEITRQAVEEHLDNCEECKTYYAQMKEEIVVENTPNLTEVKHFWKKTRAMYILRGLLIALLITPFLVCFIVDLAVNRQFTWFYIVAGGCALLYAVGGILIFKRKQKLVWSLACFSALILPYLAIIEGVVNRFFLEQPLYWMMNLAVPVTLVWLVILWLSIAAYYLFKRNAGFACSLLFILGAPANLFTNQLSNAQTFEAAYQEGQISFWCFLAAAVLSLILGIFLQSRRKRKTKSDK